MNAWIMLNRVKNHLNRTRSPRQSEERISWALTTAMWRYINDRVDNIKKSVREKTYSFEMVQRVKDELQSLVLKGSVPIDPDGKILLPPSYYYEVGLRVQINGVWRNSTPTDVGEWTNSERNVYQRPTIEHPRHIIYQGEVEVKWGGELITLGSLTEFWYLFAPPDIYVSEISLTNADTLLVGKMYAVDSGSVVYGGTTYVEGDSFQTGALTSFTGTGTVRLVVNCLLPFQAHEEIVLWASELLAETVENFNRQQMKMMERKEV